MNKFKKAWKAIGAIIKNPSLLNLILQNNDAWTDYLKRNYNLDKGLPVIDIRDLIPNQKIELNTMAFLGGSSLPTDFALIKAMCMRFEHCRYFEIGTWRGESVSNASNVATQCYTLNLSKEEILSLGLSEKYADLHAFFSQHKKNINHLFGDSRHFDFSQFDKKFDVVFIDGDHKYDFVKNDTEKVFEHLIHDSSIVIWHDYAYDPETPRLEVLSAIFDALPKTEHKNLYHVSNSMCCIYIKDSFDTYFLDTPEIPSRKFKISLEINDIKL